MLLRTLGLVCTQVDFSVLSHPGPGAWARREKQADFPEGASYLLAGKLDLCVFTNCKIEDACELACSSKKACSSWLYQAKLPINNSGASSRWRLGSLHQTKAPETGHSKVGSQEATETHKRKGLREIFSFSAKGTRLVGHRVGTTQVCLTPKLRLLKSAVLWYIGKHWRYLQGSHPVQGGLFPQNLQGSPEGRKEKKYRG